MKIETAPSYPVSIFIAGNYDFISAACAGFCDDVGLCVTVVPTRYVYTGGIEEGATVGLINYPRFPEESASIEAKAIELGKLLREKLRQTSFSIQTPATTTWFSWRDEEEASAAAEGESAGPKDDVHA